MFEDTDINGENNFNQLFRTDDLRKLQSTLEALEGIIVRSAISTNGQLQTGGYLFSLLERAKVEFLRRRISKKKS